MKNVIFAGAVALLFLHTSKAATDNSATAAQAGAKPAATSAGPAKLPQLVIEWKQHKASTIVNVLTTPPPPDPSDPYGLRRGYTPPPSPNDFFFIVTVSNFGSTPVSNVTVEYKAYNKTFANRNGSALTTYDIIGTDDQKTFDTIPAGGNVTFKTKIISNRDSSVSGGRVSLAPGRAGRAGGPSTYSRGGGISQQDFQGLWVSLSLDGKAILTKEEPFDIKRKMDDIIAKSGSYPP